MVFLKFGGTVDLQVVEASHAMVKMSLKIDESENLPQFEAIDVVCSLHHNGQYQHESMEQENELLVLYKVVPDSEYNCSGTFKIDDEVIPIPKKLVFTPCDVNIQVHLEDVTDESFRY